MQQTTTLTDLQGQIERLTYFDEESGYTIAKVKVFGNKDLITCTGNLINPTPGEIIKMKGEWTNHPQFGQQFKIVFCQTTTPSTVYGIQKYLGSGLIKGIGPVMAKRIVSMFGKDTLDVIESDIEKLVEVAGIGEVRIGKIKKAWPDQKEIRAVMIFLQTHGVSSGYAAKIFKQYGNAAIKIVQENPYRLAMDIFGIGFITADKIAENMGFAKDSLVRGEAGVLYVLNQLADQGHVYYPEQPLIELSQAILEIEAAVIEKSLLNLAGVSILITPRTKKLSHWHM